MVAFLLLLVLPISLILIFGVYHNKLYKARKVDPRGKITRMVLAVMLGLFVIIRVYQYIVR